MTAETHADARERLRPYVERAAAVSGWVMDPDPRGLSPRSWDYVARASELIARADSVLDLGTGGASVSVTFWRAMVAAPSPPRSG